jgi:hypothetical protein
MAFTTPRNGVASGRSNYSVNRPAGFAGPAASRPQQASSTTSGRTTAIRINFGWSRSAQTAQMSRACVRPAIIRNAGAPSAAASCPAATSTACRPIPRIRVTASADAMTVARRRPPPDAAVSRETNSSSALLSGGESQTAPFSLLPPRGKAPAPARMSPARSLDARLATAPARSLVPLDERAAAAVLLLPISYRCQKAFLHVKNARSSGIPSRPQRQRHRHGDRCPSPLHSPWRFSAIARFFPAPVLAVFRQGPDQQRPISVASYSTLSACFQWPIGQGPPHQSMNTTIPAAKSPDPIGSPPARPPIDPRHWAHRSRTG